MASSVRLGPKSRGMVEMQTLAASCLISPLVSMAGTDVEAHFLRASSWAPRVR